LAILAAPALLAQTAVFELAGGESRTHTLQVASGQFAEASARQVRGDVAIIVTAPDGKTVGTMDRTVRHAAERLPWIAAVSGEYKVAVRSAKGATYTLTLAAHDASENEKALAEAFRTGVEETRAVKNDGRVSAAQAKRLAPTLEMAAQGAAKGGDTGLQARMLHELSVVRETLGDLKGALAAAEHAVRLRETLPDERLELSHSLSAVGKIQTRLGAGTASIASFERALQVMREDPVPSDEATLVMNLGAAYGARGDFAKALVYFDRAIAIQKELGVEQRAATAYFNKGAIYSNSRDPQKALENLAQALRLYREAGNERQTVTCLTSIGTAYASMNELQKAEEYFAEAQTGLVRLNDPSLLAKTLRSRANVRSRLGDKPGAITLYEQSAAIARNSGDSPGLVITLMPLIALYAAEGKLDEGRAAAEESLALTAMSGATRGWAGPYIGLGALAAKAKRFDEAEKYYALGIERARAENDPTTEADGLDSRASYYESLGMFAAAMADLELALHATEPKIRALTLESARAALRSNYARRRMRLVDILARLHASDPGAGHAERAFAHLERARASSLGEMLGATQQREVSSKEMGLTAAVRDAQQALFREDVAAARKPALRAALSKAERELGLYLQVAVRPAQLRLHEALTVDQIRDTVAGDDGVVITYSLGEKKSYAWAIDAAGLRMRELPAKAVLEKQIIAFREMLSKPSSALTRARDLQAIDTAARALYTTLLMPVEDRLRNKRKVTIVPDGALAYLPFEAIGNATPLMATHRVSYAPSASIVAGLAGKKAQGNRTLMAFADPSRGRSDSTAMKEHLERGYAFTALPNARAEATAIGRLFPASKIFFGADASEGKLKEGASKEIWYLHFAAHGYFDGEKPERSGIVLAQESRNEDGFLQAREIAQLSLDADLVTLSACQSGFGKVLDGEGVQGLSRAFFLAGARSVVVSLWNVNDAATSELMRRFYAGLKAGLPKDEALRAAKLAVMKEPRWRHPYYWAPFVLQGDAGGK